MKVYPDSLKHADFPARAIDVFLKMREVTPEYLAAAKASRERIGTGCVLGFLGGRGTGKTVMSCAVANYALAFEPPRSVLYTTAHRMFMRYKDSYRQDAEERESDVHAHFIKPDLLVIDEIGKRQDSDWENRTLFDLGDARYGAKKDTILISNQTHDVFDDAIGDSLVSRMNECGGCLLFNWPSYRQ